MVQDGFAEPLEQINFETLCSALTSKTSFAYGSRAQLALSLPVVRAF